MFETLASRVGNPLGSPINRTKRFVRLNEEVLRRRTAHRLEGRPGRLAEGPGVAMGQSGCAPIEPMRFDSLLRLR